VAQVDVKAGNSVALDVSRLLGGSESSNEGHAYR